jgi:hypothetical protein
MRLQQNGGDSAVYKRRTKTMKRKDLVVGLDVAVRSWGATRRAVLLELDTKWAFSLRDGCFKYDKHIHPATKLTFAIAALNQGGTWTPDVVEGRHILMPWSNYEAQQQRESVERDLRDREQARQRNSYEKLRSRCAELLGCAVSSSRLGYAEVSLNDLYAIARKLSAATLRHDDTDQPSITADVALNSDWAK